MFRRPPFGGMRCTARRYPGTAELINRGHDAGNVRRDRSRGGAPSLRVMNPIRRPRPWVRLASVVALGFALWLLLVPRIALYYVDGDRPYDVDVKYAWGRGTSDQVMILPADLFGDEDPAAGSGGGDGLLTSVRLNCGL